MDRNENATPYKLLKARERGQAAKSTDAVSALVFVVAVIYLIWQGVDAVSVQFRTDQAALMQMHMVDGAAMWPLTQRLLRSAMYLLVPFFLALMLAAIVGNLVQTGPILSLEPLKADFDRINPSTGFKRVFSMRTLFDGARACVKLLLLFLVAYLALKSMLGQFYGLASLSPIGFLRALLADMGNLGLKMAFVLGLIALVDLIYTRYEFAKKMRMSRRELKDETKHRDGDPRIRARMRELRRELLARSLALQKTRNADVVITNPTHVAVALRYVHGEMESPQLLAKGAGHLAAAMREIAARHRIPVVQSPSLARRIYHDLPVENHVPPELYAQVARIIVWVLAMREQYHTRAAAGART
nr:EscU/YscU/HrcU family type III secretion system export apparatus switch protein [Variovorax terrae]